MTGLPERITSKIQVDPATGCWEWTACRNRHGYGQVKWEGQMKLAYNVIYRLLVGPVEDGKQLHHKCENPGCCNPGHLEQRTPKEHSHLHPMAPLMKELGQRRVCPRGHKYTLDNTMERTGGRRCLTCHREQSKRSMQRYRDKALARL